MSQYYQRLYKLLDTSARLARYQSGPVSVRQVLGDNGDMSEKGGHRECQGAIAEKENMTKIPIARCRLELAKRDRRGRQQESGDDKESAGASEVQRHIGILESQYDLAQLDLGARECVKCLYYHLPVLLLEVQVTHSTAGAGCTIQEQQTLAQSRASRWPPGCAWYVWC